MKNIEKYKDIVLDELDICSLDGIFTLLETLELLQYKGRSRNKRQGNHGKD